MPTTVEPDVLVRLLDLQTEDTAIKRLGERKAGLPEAARLAEVEARLAELASDHEIATRQADEIGREYGRLEGEIELIDQKIGREEQRMYAGTVSNPKELSALQAEVASLKTKKSGLEDGLLEVMEQREEATGTLERITADRDAASAEAVELREVVAKLGAEIDAEVNEHEAKRTAIAPTLPSDLLDLYEKLRATKGGVGAAALRQGMCEGCHTKLPAKEAERIRAEGGLQRCDNCRRILVVV
ncbi:MAG TPA: C4-type zinc ribbon domain-containing protein [Actinomycetota bacterium]|nr:C4-type zinc ribbon domain-containing protein [Actinomycetota bacterium]